MSEQSFRQALGVKRQSVGAVYDSGHRAAKQKYLVTIPCTLYGKTIEVEGATEKLAAREFFEERRWGHKSCIDS